MSMRNPFREDVDGQSRAKHVVVIGPSKTVWVLEEPWRLEEWVECNLRKDFFHFFNLFAFSVLHLKKSAKMAKY